MSITTDLDAWWATLTDYEEGNAAKAEFQRILADFDQSLNKLQAMNAAGDFSTLPAAVITKFVWAWQQFNTARNAVKADAGFMEAMNWRP